MTHQEITSKYRDALTTKQVTEEYRFLNANTLRYYRARNEGPKSWSIGKKVLYNRADVEAWIAEQEAASTRGGAA